MVEGNNQNLEVGCKPIDIDLEENNCLVVERDVDKWGSAELKRSGAQVYLAVVHDFFTAPDNQVELWLAVEILDQRLSL